ncbi:aspartate dehydrogenase [Pseudogracilibacillus sp. SE30717A]|uniref:aspartate dehydrogenase n=1 Tax=Pseudogracilibacillus sp. SE30717A TaxID=3098293 RepID=UPI00300DE85E
MEKKLRIGIIGCGTIGGYVLEAVKSNEVDNAEVVVVCGRTNKSRGKDKVEQYNIPWITNPEELMNYDVNVVVETASHEALSKYGPKILRAGIDLIPLSLGTLVDTEVLEELISEAKIGNSILHVPSGGIGGLDALQAALIAGIDSVTMTTRKAPIAWTGIPYVEKMDIDLENMTEPTVLYEGSARHCVKEFPQNINIAAALSLAGIGFDDTKIRIVADPHIEYNTHEISWKGKAGRFKMTLENEPVPINPRTTYMACLSAVASLNRTRNPYRIGT